MHRSSFQKERINIFHADEGEDIADAIKETFEKYQVHVDLCNVSKEEIKTFHRCAQVIFLTPEVHRRIIDGRLTNVLQQLASSVHLILLHHHSVNIEDEKTKEALSSNIPNFSSWTSLSLGSNNHQFKLTLLEILQIIDPPDILPSLTEFTLVPTSIWNTKDDVFIILRKNATVNDVEIRVSDFALESSIKTVRQINATTFVFKPSGLACGKKKVEVLVAGKTAGRSSLEIKPKIEMLNQLIHDVVNPIELLCQTLNTDLNRESLDLELNDIFTNGGRNPMSEFADANFDYTTDIQKQSELPTLLHFAAKFGLTHLCSTLLSFPGGRAALKIKNKDEKTPYKVAIHCGNTELADNVLFTGLEVIDTPTSDDNVFIEEDIYEQMGYLSQPGNKSPAPPLPRRDTCPEIMVNEEGYAVMRKKPSLTRGRRVASARSFSLTDSGTYSDRDTECSLLDSNEDVRSRRMTARMSKLYADDEVILPKFDLGELKEEDTRTSTKL